MSDSASRFFRRFFGPTFSDFHNGRIGLFRCVLFFSLTILMVSPPALAADGDLDTSFGDHGKEIIQIAADQRDFAKSVAIQSDGKIVIGGELGDFGLTYNTAVLVRLNPDGSLDQTFGTGGKVLNPGQLHLPKLIIQPDGKIVTAGATALVGISLNFAVVRYNSDGTLDQSFGNGGYAVNGDGNANDVILQPDGKIILVGTVPVFRHGSDFLLARFNADGSIDQTFGVGGRVTTSFTSCLDCGDSAFDGELQADGKIVVVGAVSGTPAVLVRYNPNGSIDLSFGLEGSVFSPSFNASARRLVIQTDGKIVVGGGAFVVARYLSDGHLDQSFGTSGRSAGGFGTGNGNLYAITLQPDGKILIAGSVYYNNTGNSDFVVGRYNTNGLLDASWGNSGFTITEFTGALDEAFGLAAQANGRVIAVGYAAEPGASYHDFAVARYQGSAVATVTRRSPFDFDGDGKTDISIFRPSAGEWWYSRSSNSQVAATQFGSPSDKPVPADLTGDGKTDIAVFRSTTGQWFVLRSEDSTYYAFNFGVTGDIPAPADFDNDGKADPTVYRGSSGTWYIARSSNGQVTIAQFGAENDLPVPADYDGDGRADIAVFRQFGAAGAEWWVQQSSAGLRALQFGTSTDKAVPGDFTGDGKTDIAVWRPSTGQWFILRSEDSSYFAFPWGSNGDIPTPGDYDGDGRSDAGVFRPTNATWYVSRSTAGTLISGFGVSTDQPVPNAYVR